MKPKRFDVSIDIAGGLLWIAPRSLGGYSPKVFSEIWMGGGEATVEDLIRRGIMMPLTLYQDDGYIVRFVEGDLTASERDEWTAHACMNMGVPCGALIASGVLTPDFDSLEFPEFQEVTGTTSVRLGAYIKVVPGVYRIDLYSYPPGDLSGAWGHIVDPETFGEHPSLQSEAANDFYQRTRPGEEMPPWIRLEDEDSSFVDFVVQISPEDLNLPPVEMSEDGFGIKWSFRKPEKCPLGLVSEYVREG